MITLRVMGETDKLLEPFRRLRCDRTGGRPRPHKAVMLLSVSVLAEAGELGQNRIAFSPRLLDIFRGLFDAVKQGSDQFTPHNPFFHLKSDGFWQLHPTPGMEERLRHLRAVKGPGELREVVAYATLDEPLFLRLHDPAFRHAFQAVLIQTYLSHAATEAWAALEQETLIAARQRELLGYPAAHAREKATAKVRSAAFRRMVKDLYDTRCAACGMRFFYDDVDVIDAAHLIPFSVSGDDRPQNGIALCKNHHWLMDHAILAPGPGRAGNYRNPIWHVRQGLDDRLEEHRVVLELKGRPVLVPREEPFRPCREGLDWRMDRLRRGEVEHEMDYAG